MRAHDEWIPHKMYKDVQKCRQWFWSLLAMCIWCIPLMPCDLTWYDIGDCKTMINVQHAGLIQPPPPPPPPPTTHPQPPHPPKKNTPILYPVTELCKTLLSMYYSAWMRGEHCTMAVALVRFCSLQCHGNYLQVRKSYCISSYICFLCAKHQRELLLMKRGPLKINNTQKR